MQQKPSSNSRLLLFALFSMSAFSAGAQDFKGFYGNDYTSGHSSQRHFWRKAARRYNNPVQSNPVLNYGNNGTYYANGSHAIPFQGFYANTNPAGSVVINILPASFPPSAGTSNYYYYNGTDYRRNNTSNVVFPDQRRDDDLQLPASARSIKINGTRFYEMDGNYYRADYFDNAGRSYTTSNGRGENNFFRVEDGSVKDNNIYLPVRISDNVAYVNDGRPAAKTVYLTDGYQNENGEYVNRRAADNTILMSQQEQQAMRDENALLKQQLQQKDADNRAVMKAAMQRQDEQQAKQADQQRDDAFKRTNEAAEQARREQKATDNQRIKEQQEANKAEEKRRKKTNNYVSEADIYSNLKVGDTVDQIPKDSKEVTIDGKKIYLAPNNTFYRKQKGKYTVVGKQ